MAVSIFAPISIGNLSVGFDSLGLAVSPIDNTRLGDIVTVEALPQENAENEFALIGSQAGKLPSDKEDNLVWRALLAFETKLKTKNIQTQSIKITLSKNIGVSSGLGSSACSIVAAVVALNEFYQQPFDKQQLLELMGELESEISGSLHYDNVAPSFLGGLQLMLSQSKKISQSIPTFDDVYWLIAYPDIEVSTKHAREILPQDYPRHTMIEFAQNLAGFIDASYRKDKNNAFDFIQDVVAEPYRKELLPNFELAKKTLLDLGCLTVGISGSGPTLFAASDNIKVAELAQTWLQQHYLQNKDGFVHICLVDKIGARAI